MAADESSPQAGFYKRFFAWMMSKLDDHDAGEVDERRKSMLGELEGTVVEIGAGAGANMSAYPPGIRLIAVEPNPYMHSYLLAEAEQYGVDVELTADRGERLPIVSDSADAVVITLVLCSVDEPEAMLREVFRVLKPGGRLVFVEHVAAPAGTGLRRAQRLVRPLWKVIGDGCHPDRETWRTLERAGFVDLDYERLEADVPIPIVRPHIAGTARKPTGDERDGDGPK